MLDKPWADHPAYPLDWPMSLSYMTIAVTTSKHGGVLGSTWILERMQGSALLQPLIFICCGRERTSVLATQQPGYIAELCTA
jgi:hypothetical protein